MTLVFSDKVLIHMGSPNFNGTHEDTLSDLYFFLTNNFELAAQADIF